MGLNAELTRSNRELDDFAYIVSHDLREPLRGIHNYSHFLLEDYSDKLDGEGTSRLRTLVRLSQHMEALIASLLHYSHIGRDDPPSTKVNLNQVVQDAMEISRLVPDLLCAGVLPMVVLFCTWGDAPNSRKSW
jgi:light-regulated signal transduction histidine kinase (bacteriophytochrome)